MSREIVLNFHGIGTPPDRIDPSERPYWIGVDLFEDIVAQAASRPEITFTFDDGNRSDLEIAAPVLAKHGRTGAFFILTGRLADPGYLAPADIRALDAMGMEIGLHGRDHVDWRRLDDRVLNEETVAAREILAEAAGQAVSDVSIPFGKYDRRIIRHLCECGFSSIFTSDGGPTDAHSRVKSRTSFRSDMTPRVVGDILAGATPPVAAMKRTASTFLRRYIV